MITITDLTIEEAQVLLAKLQEIRKTIKLKPNGVQKLDGEPEPQKPKE